MPHEPGSPAAWMRYARSDLQLARTGNQPGVLYETLCFHAQQSVEKAIKAILIAYQISVPKTHNIEFLVDLLPVTQLRPSLLDEAVTLTDYAVIYRYPGDADAVTEDEYQLVLRIAAVTVQWAESILVQLTGENEDNSPQNSP